MARPTLPAKYTERGWVLEWDNYDWVIAVNTQKNLRTWQSYPSPHRGLKFTIREIEKLDPSPPEETEVPQAPLVAKQMRLLE